MCTVDLTRPLWSTAVLLLLINITSLDGIRQFSFTQDMDLRSESEGVRSGRVKRIIGGGPATVGQFPWLVSLRAHVPTKFFQWFAVHYDDVYCGGAIINKRWILTAAHCFYVPNIPPKAIANPSNWFVKAGDVKLSFTTGQRLCAIWNRILRRQNVNCWYLNVELIVTHPGFVYDDNLNNDIALVKLSSDLPLAPVDPNIDALSLPTIANSTAWPAAGTNCSIQGWGCTSYGGPLEQMARSLNLPIVDDSQCSQSTDATIGLTRLCAGFNLGGKGLCKGDSGGPLVCPDSDGVWRQAGIASFTSSTAPGNVPGVFTRVSEYMDWINSTISSN